MEPLSKLTCFLGMQLTVGKLDIKKLKKLVEIYGRERGYIRTPTLPYNQSVHNIANNLHTKVIHTFQDALLEAPVFLLGGS